MLDGDVRVDREWQADRQLAKGLLSWLKDQLSEQGKTWQDVSALGAYEGPGSFTGLRIGLTVMNSLAESLNIPIVGATGDDWQNTARASIENGENDIVVLPLYDRDATITRQRK